ncbi:hypothetical protein [Nocardia fluminea]|uniref:hypothetical protein n=1 Tax=Nocardia fluminea TaxID=134984 RepID=UPI003439633A
MELAYRVSIHVENRTAIAAMLVSVEWRANPSVTTRNFGRLRAAARNELLAPAYLVSLVIHLLWQGCDEDADEVVLTLCAQPHDSDRTIEFLWCWLEFTHPEAIPSDVGERSIADRRDPATSPYAYAVDVLHGMMSGAGHKSSVFAAQSILNHHRLGGTTIDALVVAVEGLIHFGNLQRRRSVVRHAARRGGGSARTHVAGTVRRLARGDLAAPRGYAGHGEVRTRRTESRAGEGTRNQNRTPPRLSCSRIDRDRAIRRGP